MCERRERRVQGGILLRFDARAEAEYVTAATPDVDAARRRQREGVRRCLGKLDDVLTVQLGDDRGRVILPPNGSRCSRLGRQGPSPAV